MMPRARRWWHDMQSSFWFLPLLIILGAVGLATGLVAVDSRVDLPFIDRWPLLFGTGASGSRGLLTAVASSMITVAGVVFSITIVALALTSSQYSSRVLRNFMSDRFNQTALGVFLGIYAYCLVVLRTIRGEGSAAFIPSLAVLGGLALAFAGIGVLIVFIHHISASIQASSIISVAAEETIKAVDQLFPEGLGEDADEDAPDLDSALAHGQTWATVTTPDTGYIQSVDQDALLAVARERGAVLRMERGIGEFVVEGTTPILSVASCDGVDEATVTALRRTYLIGCQRTLLQDVAFGIRQIVDIALRALSPGINDTTTAVMCVDYLTSVLVRLAARRVVTRARFDAGELRVIARGASFERHLAEAFDQIQRCAEKEVRVLLRQLEALETIARRTTNERRRHALRRQADQLSTLIDGAPATERDRADVAEVQGRLRQALAGAARGLVGSAPSG